MPRPSNYLPAFLSLAILFAACEQKSSSLVDPRGIAPVLWTANVSPGFVNTDTINLGPIRDPQDLLTIPVQISGIVHSSAPTRVRYSIRFSGSFDALTSGEIPVADSTFAATASMSFFRSAIGTVLVSLVATESHGATSTEFLLPIAVSRLNHAPVISTLTAPDTVSPSPTVTQFGITVHASDPDGASDIRFVFRRGTTGNVFYLNDAGLNGDAVAGDGIFTETVSVSPAPPPGSYTFTFRAVDRSNDTSNVLSKTIVVTP